jgi:4-amino-4-deoxy-L-arabinose transferase-like glycosyltransferase
MRRLTQRMRLLKRSKINRSAMQIPDFVEVRDFLLGRRRRCDERALRHAGVMGYPCKPDRSLRPVRFFHDIMEAAPATPTAVQPAKTNAFAFILRVAPLLLALGLFLALTLHQLHLPGFYYDEALDLVPMLHVMRGEQPELLRNIGIGRFPIMLLDYMGSLGGYLTLPFMAIFGSGDVAARAQPIFFSCVTIVLAWLLARRWFGHGVAAVTVLLLAANPSFIWFSRQGISVTSVMTTFSLGSLLLLTKLRIENAELRKHAILNSQFFICLFAGVLLGLGLWAKFLFFRWLVVLVVMGCVFYVGRDRKHNFSLSHFLPFALPLIFGFALGAAPLLYYNLVGLLRDGEPWTLHLLLQSLFNPTQQFGVDNRNFLANLQKSIDDVRVFVDGSYFWYLGITFSNVYAVPALLISAVVGSVMAVARVRVARPHPQPPAGTFRLPKGEGRRQEAVRFFAVLAGIITLVVLGAFTVTGLWSTHQFIMLPLPQMVIACAVVWVAEAMGYWLLAKARVARTRNLANSQLPTVMTGFIVIALLALPFARDLWVSERHHETLERTGGSGRFSDAVYKLAGWLDENQIHQPIALDWGIEKQVRVLTADRVRPLEIFGYTPDPNVADDIFNEQVKTLIQDPSRQYIVLWDRFAVYNRRAAFTEIAHQAGKQVVETFIAHEKSGLPVYVVLQAK